MTPGALLGAPVLVPLLLTGLTGALLFLLVARVTNARVALLSCLIWIGDPLNLRFRAGYFSETTTEAMWFISWWALLEWRETRKRGWLLALAAAMGSGAITRPLTMLAFAVPIGFVVIRDVIRTRAWTDFALATVLGIIVLGIVPLWSAETTGNWALTPQTLYTRQYLPYDKPGFGVDATPPLFELNPVNRFTYDGFFDEHVNHTVARLPVTAWNRLRVIAREQWKNERIVLVPFVVLGLFAMNTSVAFAAICSLALFLGYLSYGHWAEWPLYYFEAMPILSVLAALGVARAIEWIGARRASTPAFDANALRVVAAALTIIAAHRVYVARADHLRTGTWDFPVRAELARVIRKPSVVFVHYIPGVRPHANMVTNFPDLADEPVWFVNDLGDRNRELMRFAGPRIPLDFYESGARIELDTALLHAPRSR